MGCDMLTLVPWYYRVLAVALLSLTLIAFGWVKGANHVQKEFDAFEARVNAAGEAQSALNKQITKKGEEITASTGGEYAKGDADVVRTYGPGRVRNANPGSGKVARVPQAASGTNGRPADAGFGAGIRPPSKDECPDLKADIARTTVMLIYLQDWVEQQSEVRQGLDAQ